MANAESSDGSRELLFNSLDRLNEAHWHLHQMEQWFHVAEPFRFSLNCFLRALKEVPQLIQMELQHVSGFPAWYKPRREALREDPLLDHLFKARDIVVHKKALLPKSSGFFGITRGSKLKLGISLPINPLEDSDAVMHRLASDAREQGDFLGFFDPHDEDTAPCIERTWRLLEFPDNDLVDLGARAWHGVAVIVSDAAIFVGVPDPQIKLTCMHGSHRVKMRVYDRKELAKLVYGPGSKAATGPMSPGSVVREAKAKQKKTTTKKRPDEAP